jgi:hypothetical protein
MIIDPSSRLSRRLPVAVYHIVSAEMGVEAGIKLAIQRRSYRPRGG